MLINQLLAEKVSTLYQDSRLTKQQRRARTRTLIQIGGLVKLAGLLDVCNIQEGEDLQSDLEQQDKAAVLLGLLTEVCENILSTTTKLDHWKMIGIRMMKMSNQRKLQTKIKETYMF